MQVSCNFWIEYSKSEFYILLYKITVIRLIVVHMYAGRIAISLWIGGPQIGYVGVQGA